MIQNKNENKSLIDFTFQSLGCAMNTSMNTSKILTTDDLLVIRKGLHDTSLHLRKTIRLRSKEASKDDIKKLWEEVDSIDDNKRRIDDQIFDSIMLDVEQPKQQILTSIQRVDEKIRVLEEMNQDIGNLIKILEPFTSMLTLVFSPGSGFGVVKIAELLAEIEAVA